MLDLGFVSAILAEKSFDEVIEFASENRFKCVEMMCWPVGKAERRYAGVTHINVDEISDKKVTAIKEVYENIRIGTMEGAKFPTFEDGLRELMLCESILESNEKECWVKV